MYYLTINAGSSSVKCSLFNAETLEQQLTAAVSGIGFTAGRFTVSGNEPASHEVSVSTHQDALELIKQWLGQTTAPGDIQAIGYRIVHGGPNYSSSCDIDDQVVADLQTIVPLDPTHLPVQLTIVETLRHHFPDARHIACFDTGFFHNLPLTARLLPLPRKYEAEGVRRYGFHGLSYRYLLQAFEQTAGYAAAHGKVILAHLGNGVSLAAVQNGQPIDTTMSFTPFGGIPMSTRSGDLDPGLVSFLARKYQLSAEQFEELVGRQSGLLGISGFSSDMKQLLEQEATDSQAKDAVDIFCYHVKKTIGAYTAAMGGLHSLVFSGGIGEVAPKIRTRICEGLADLGITLDDSRNLSNTELISAEGSRVGVHVLATDEAVIIANDVARIIKQEA